MVLNIAMLIWNSYTSHDNRSAALDSVQNFRMRSFDETYTISASLRFNLSIQAPGIIVSKILPICTIGLCLQFDQDWGP
jgi:hypothetical protein